MEKVYGFQTLSATLLDQNHCSPLNYFINRSVFFWSENFPFFPQIIFCLFLPMSIREKLVCEPWFSHIKSGLKTIEGRLKFEIEPGDKLVIKSVDDVFEVSVTQVVDYDSFEHMLEMEGLKNVLPGVSSIQEGVRIYRQFYTLEKEQSTGVIAIHIKRNEVKEAPTTKRRIEETLEGDITLCVCGNHTCNKYQLLEQNLEKVAKKYNIKYGVSGAQQT